LIAVKETVLMVQSLNHLSNLLFHTVRARLTHELRLYYLHFIWWFVEPMLNMATYYVVFAIMLNQKTDNYVPFLLTGIVFWSWFNRSLQNSSSSILQGKELIAQTDIPKTFFPIATVFQDFVKQSFVLIVLLLFLVIYGMPVTWSWTALPILMAVEFILIIGLSVLLAAIVPFFPDFKFIISAGLQLMFFASGIFYDIDRTVLPVHRVLCYLNPMAGLIRNYRIVLLHGLWPDWPYILTTFLSTLVLLIFSMFLVRRFEHIYPKIVI
jgi:lipopolysaccharide transport system permease protein